MSYTKPGVLVTQEQATTTPVLISPELEAVVIGRGYHIQDIFLDNSQLNSPVYSGISANFNLSDVNSDYYDVSGDESLVVVDLIESADTINHLVYGEDFSVSNNVVTLSGGITTENSYIRCGFRANKPTISGLQEMESASDIENNIGLPVTYNPLAFAASIAQSQFGTAVNVYGIPDDTVSEYNEALYTLESEEVYAIAPLSHRVSESTMVAHANSMSLAANKKERVIVVNRPIPSWTGSAHSENSTEKGTTAEAVRDAYLSTQEKRLFLTYPDMVYVEETRHIATLSPTYIENSLSEFTTVTDNSYYIAKFATDTEVGSYKYKAGQNITESIWNDLKTEGYHELTALVPAPGFYYNAAVVGQIVGKTPEQPLTNFPIAGLERTFGSQDYFSESDLNTIAKGGVYILTQRSNTAPIVSRHQMSTNTLSVAKRELSVTTALDYTAKYIRNSLAPYIGRYVINSGFLSMVSTMITNIGDNLKEKGYIKDLKVNKVEQSAISPDTVLCEISVAVLYPVNYINITLVF